MVPTPPAGRFLTVVLLLFLLGGVPARADGGFYCRDCGSLPEGYTIDPARCQLLTPLLWGSPAAQAPRDVEAGQFIEFDLAGDGSHPVRVWVGVASFNIPYFAVFDGSRTASFCSALGSFEELAHWGGSFAVWERKAGLPYLRISAQSRIGYCGNHSALVEVAWLAVRNTWTILTAESRWGSGPCAEEGQPDPHQLRWELQKKLHAEGVSAYKQKDFVSAERLWRQVETERGSVASSDLGVLLAQQGRFEEAEPRLVLAAAVYERALDWLNLADFYWMSKQRVLAARAYRRYIEVLTHPKQRRRGTIAPTPVERAVQRAAPVRARKP
ncbi:hypothetical protein ACLESO_06230 [Pyxidicoccus sp. 3LG]